MNELLKKYFHNELSPEDLESLKVYLQKLSDEEFSELIQKHSGHSEIVGDIDLSLEKIKHTIDEEIYFQDQSTIQQSGHTRFKRIYHLAASILLPIILVGIGVCGILYYQEKKKYSDHPHEIYVTTGLGERSTVTLPDGSIIKMNSLSSLAYLDDREAKRRHLYFSGEGHFSITSDKDNPFEIETPTLNVTVLGTEFALNVRKSSMYNELYLEKGLVDIVSTSSQKKVSVSAGQFVIYSVIDGSFMVESFDSGTSNLWHFSGVEFENAKPDSLIYQIEKIYNVTLSDNIRQSINDDFTGTLPNDDLDATLFILSRIYGFTLPYTPNPDTPLK